MLGRDTTATLLQALRAASTGGPAPGALQDMVREHATWLEDNTSQQLAAYMHFVTSRSEAAGGDAAVVAGRTVDDEDVRLGVFGGKQPASVALAMAEQDDDPVASLEQRVRSVVRSPSCPRKCVASPGSLPASSLAASSQISNRRAAGARR